MSDRAPRGRRLPAIPARLRIVAWIVLTTLLGLGAVTITVRTTLMAEVATNANADIVQEIEELSEFATVGRDPETARPFASTEALLDVYLRRQRPGRSEVLLGYVRGSNEVIAARQTDPEVFGLYDITRDAAMLRMLIEDESLSGVTTTPSGELRWGRVDLAADQAADHGGALVVAQFTEAATERVDHITRLIVAVGTGALLLVSGIAWLVAGQILRPVRTVRQAAAKITERDLTKRIPVQGRDDVAALATTFNSMLDRLEDAFATQRRFVDDAGHELRTPITIIHGHLELLSDDPADRQATILLVLDELQRMSRIVSDLLLLAKSERPDFVQVEPVEVADLTLEIDSKVQVLADRRWVLAQVADGTADLDPQRVTQAVLQLAQNAVQHTVDGSEIRLSSTFQDGGLDGGSTLTFTVRDFGPGVQAEDAEKIFERFAHGSTNEPPGDRPGAGLGLAIVRAIAEGHGGSAFVRSREGHGATFGISLPLRSVSSARAAPEVDRSYVATVRTLTGATSARSREDAR